MAKTVKEIMVGLDIQRAFTQMTYFFTSLSEPVTVGPAPGQQVIPSAMARTADGSWVFRDEKGEALQETLPAVYHVADCGMGDTVAPDGGGTGPAFGSAWFLSEYLKKCIGLLHMYMTEETVVHLMVTVNRLTEIWSKMLVRAWEMMGRERKYLYMQDHLASFYYYTLNQHKKNWNQDTALLEYENDCINGYVLHIDTSSRPYTATVQLAASQKIDESLRAGRNNQEWNQEKDRLFFELLKKVFERRNVAVSYLTGDFFQKTWAERSIQYLCYRRQAFQGQNLYSRGACCAAMERAGIVPERRILYSGDDMIPVSLGMEMRIRGKETYYPLVNAGINWYEAWHVCEFIPDEEQEIRLLSSQVSQEDVVTHLLLLRRLGKRPNRTLRVRMTVYFTAPSCCRIEAEDLGFGDLVPSSGETWVREIHF